MRHTFDLLSTRSSVVAGAGGAGTSTRHTFDLLSARSSSPTAAFSGFLTGRSLVRMPSLPLLRKVCRATCIRYWNFRSCLPSTSIALAIRANGSRGSTTTVGSESRSLALWESPLKEGWGAHMIG